MPSCFGRSELELRDPTPIPSTKRPQNQSPKLHRGTLRIAVRADSESTDENKHRAGPMPRNRWSRTLGIHNRIRHGV
eukprot:6637770-Alexandrium_andersonii.AAC.1